MADLEKAKHHPEAQLWEQLDEVQAGLLSVAGSDAHMRPMTHLTNDRPRTLWFMTEKTSELTRAVGEGALAQFGVIGKDHDYHACLRGALRQSLETDVLDAFWSPVLAAWFERKEEACLLEFSIRDAMIWASAENAALFGWEILKANLGGGKPDVGVVNTVTF